MRYGFVVDQNRCIGCHACTVACKEEHSVPIGVNRTWVKYIEKGSYPETRRHFAVLRCNHCDDAPCITICPTVALFRRENGIVDFDGERCIGCKSCMQACPYDALYIDPNTGTAAKCNFCAHRVEIELKPSCEVVCPTQAILSGDLDDAGSEISRVVAMEKVSQRKLEKGTRPKLFYVGVDMDLLQPTAMQPQSTHLWADKQPGEDPFALIQEENATRKQGLVREVYDVPHTPFWGRKIVSYLWTKSIAAGVLLVAAVLLGTGQHRGSPLLNYASPLLALGFVGVTTLLLIFDLKRPERFFYILTKPNPRSWLALGGYILILYGCLAALWFLLALTNGSVPGLLFSVTGILAICASGYSAFLFAQAKGRDFWQSPLFLWHLLVQSLTAGTATLIVFGTLLDTAPDLLRALSQLLSISLVLSLMMVLGELSLSPISAEVQRAANLLTRGALRGSFWGIVIGLGGLLPLALILGSGFQGGSPYLPLLASLLALAGVWVFEDLWIKAGQAFPLS